MYNFHLFLVCFLLVSSYGKAVGFLVYVVVYCVGAIITTLMSVSDGLVPYLFYGKKEKTRSMKEAMDRCVYFPPELAFSFIDNMIQAHFPSCTLNWRVNNYVPRHRKSMNRRNESTFIII